MKQRPHYHHRTHYKRTKNTEHNLIKLLVTLGRKGRRPVPTDHAIIRLHYRKHTIITENTITKEQIREHRTHYNHQLLVTLGRGLAPDEHTSHTICPYCQTRMARSTLYFS